MFDFFKEMYHEFVVNDVDAYEAARREKMEEKKKKKAFLPSEIKAVVIVMGGLYLLIAGVSIFTMREFGSVVGAMQLIRLILLSACDVAAIVCIMIGKKKTEIAGLILFLVFMVLQSCTMFIL